MHISLVGHKRPPVRQARPSASRTKSLLQSDFWANFDAGLKIKIQFTPKNFQFLVFLFFLFSVFSLLI